ncbi:hypothetical protein [Tistrella mobilis]
MVDLDGHGGGNRIGIFARWPAALQIQAGGYLPGTGLPVMDGLVTPLSCCRRPWRGARMTALSVSAAWRGGRNCRTSCWTSLPAADRPPGAVAAARSISRSTAGPIPAGW